MTTSFILKTNPSGTYSIGFINGQIGMVTGRDYVRQRITTKLQFYFGEWYLDTSQGVPWYEDVLVKPVNLILTDSIIKNTILTTPGVTGLTQFSSTFDAKTRNYSVSFRAATTYGTLEFNFPGQQLQVRTA